MQLNKFIDIMEDIGFELIMYRADIKDRDTCNPLAGELITNSKNLREIYSACWYGEEFFTYLFPPNLVSDGRGSNEVVTLNSDVDRIYLPKNKFISGEYLNSQESHHFFIITTSNKAYVLNTYGGELSLYIQTLNLGDTDDLINGIINSNQGSFEEFFGIIPIKTSVSPKFDSIELIIYNNYIESLDIISHIKSKTIGLIKMSRTDIDTDELIKIYNRIK